MGGSIVAVFYPVSPFPADFSSFYSRIIPQAPPTHRVGHGRCATIWSLMGFLGSVYYHKARVVAWCGEMFKHHHG
jgi:hypothetical protein